MTEQSTVHEPVTNDTTTAFVSGEDVASTIDASVTTESPNRHEDVPARTIPRSSTGAMCARAGDAPTSCDRLAHDAAEAARTTGKRTDLLRYLRLRRRST